MRIVKHYLVPLGTDLAVDIEMGQGARLLDIAYIGNQLIVIADVDSDSRPRRRRLILALPGGTIRDGLPYVGTTVVPASDGNGMRGMAILHVFDGGESALILPTGDPRVGGGG